ncbi:MAG TPA: DUF4398 domain-containing protein [Polyangiaceae bacterium]|jgi:hypothetical protein
MNVRTWVYWCISGTMLLACGGAPVPHDALSAAQADVKGAEVGGAGENPQAALHVKLAKDQIEVAQKQMKDGDNEEAARTLDRAQADAELALALAKEAKAQNDASEASEQVGKLRKEMNK